MKNYFPVEVLLFFVFLFSDKKKAGVFSLRENYIVVTGLHRPISLSNLFPDIFLFPSAVQWKINASHKCNVKFLVATFFKKGKKR